MSNKKEKKEKATFFGKIANFTEKYRWFILITWILLAAVAAPWAININEKIETNELEFLSETDAGQGLEILAEKFPRYSGGFILVIDELNESDILDSELIEFLDLIESTFENNTEYPGITEVISVYSLLKQFQLIYNETSDEIQNFLNSTFTNEIPAMYEFISIANETTKFAIDMFEEMSWYYLSAWANISKFIYYTANQTSGYTNGFFNSTELDLMYNWTQIDTGSLNQYLSATLPIAPLIPSMQANPFFADNMTTSLTFQLLNTSIAMVYNETEMGIPYIQSPNYLYLVLLNSTFDYLLSQTIHLTNALFDDYYSTASPGILDFQQGLITQLNVFGNLTTLKDSMKDQASLALVNMIPPGSEMQLLLQLAYNLRSEDYEVSPIYKAAFIDFITLGINASLGTLFENYTISGFELDPSLFFQDFDLEAMVTTLYETPDYLLSYVTTAIIQQLSLFVEQKIEEIFPYPVTIQNLPSDIYDSFISEDGSTMIIQISVGEGEQAELEDLTPIIRTEIESIKQENEFSFSTYITGDVALFFDIKDVATEDLSKTDITTVLFVLGVLVIVFLSPLTPLVPLVLIGMGILIVNTLFLVLSNVIQMSSYSIIITSVVMLGAGVDYCLFMLFRYKEQRRKGDTKSAAVKESTKRIGESILTSGLTVMVGFGSLLLSRSSLLRVMGLGPIVGIAVSLLIALTLVPVVLHFAGDKIYWPRLRKKKSEDEQETQKTKKEEHTFKERPFWDKMIRFTLDHPLVVIAMFLVVSGPFVYFGISAEQSYDITSTIPDNIESIRGMNVLADAYSAGELQPIQLLFIWDEAIPLNSTSNLPVDSILQELELLISTMSENLANISHINTITRPNGEFIPPELVDSIHLEQMRMYFSQDNDTILLNLYLDVDPFGKDGLDRAFEIKDSLDSWMVGLTILPTATTHVTGMTALYSELNQTLIKDTPIIIIATMVGIFLILFFLLGSVFTPIRLELTILLSVFVSLGVTNLIFHYGFNQPIAWFMPVMLFVIMFGLGMDFDILLVSRIKEEVEKGATDREATFIAVKSTAKMITSSGLIMAASFFSLMLSNLWPLKIIGFSIGIAVLLDATLIRLFLVPALMMVLKRLNWWPYLRLSKETVTKRYKKEGKKEKNN